MTVAAKSALDAKARNLKSITCDKLSIEGHMVTNTQELHVESCTKLLF